MPRAATKTKAALFPGSLLKGEEEALSRSFVRRGLGLEEHFGMQDFSLRFETALSSAYLVASALEPTAQTTLPTDQLTTLQLRMGQIETRVADLEERQLQTFPTFLNSLGNDRITLRKPIAVMVEIDLGGEVVARWTEALLEGEGATQIEALQDLADSIAEAFLDLQEAVQEDKSLAGYPERLWRVLAEFVAIDAATAGE